MSKPNNKSQLSIGIDIGTTTVSASVVDTENGKQIDSYTVLNNSALPVKEEYRKEQDAAAIFRAVNALLNEISEKYPNVRSIGVTGQMHGVLYVDKNGEAVSPLYTWQDKRADLIYKKDCSYAQTITDLTKKPISSGYGAATHFYNVKNGLVPPDANKFCSIGDYIGMRLSGEKTPKTDATNAASIGLFDLERNVFDENAIGILGLEKSIFPEVVQTNTLIGRFKDIPVYVAVGDNQASFFGSVANEKESVLVNYGTGSQISFIKEKIEKTKGLEIRPYRDGAYLYSGAAICGGRAYAVIEKFFSEYLDACNIEHGKQYDIMNALAKKALERETDLAFETTFCGTRTDPEKNGTLKNITENNFTPSNVIYATLVGMATELFEFFGGSDRKNYRMLVASGNGVRKNEVLQSVLSSVFDMPVLLPTIKEEAAYGAALWVQVPSSDEKIKTAVKSRINYKEGVVI